MDSNPRLIPFKVTVGRKKIDKIIDGVMASTRKHVGTSPRGQEFDTFVQDLASAFPKNINPAVIYTSVLDLVGQVLTPERLKMTAWRLAANLPKLKKSTPVPPWLRQQKYEWCLVKIVRGKLGKNAKGKLGFWYDYRVITGSPAGLRFKLFWSSKFCRMIAKVCGFGIGRRQKLRYSNGAELVGMQLYFLLDPTLSTEKEPRHYYFRVPSSLKSANQKILKMRMRILPCPQGFSLTQLECAQCPFGYDKCPAGTHPLTYKAAACPRCLQKEAWFDPASTDDVCLACATRLVTDDQNVS